ncbi:TusE/DsrC/DsvC family sulfur relay protein [Reinekea blandensis]|uniref:Sulfurtransferase n=1 Tax=Reinekea blandensis MED297 TaxID=314283 RepID=A4BDR1_9GAMM|nr:TusE/DsrC/DsvC family sulfur relay protein [Reinekea blandensis]EAR09670.1 hypothetical desulfoviridin gamma subunit [Reinekea blandensis MED297]
MAYERDHLGFLQDARQWDMQWVHQSAEALNLEITDIDEQIIQALRDFYFEYDLSPAMRPLVKHIKQTVGPDQGNSIWLMQRYGESPARTLALLAGLPKPKNCL